MFVGESVVLGKRDGELTDAAGFEGADGCSGAFADLIDREGLDLAQADDEQALSLDAWGACRRRVSPRVALNSPSAEEAGCGVGDGVGGGHERDERLGVLADSDVHREDGQQRCCKFSSILK